MGVTKIDDAILVLFTCDQDETNRIPWVDPVLVPEATQSGGMHERSSKI